MKIIFIGGFYPKEHFNQIRKDSKGPLANANNVLQWSYIEGLKKHSELSSLFDLHIISIPQIGAFPFRFRKFKFNVDNKQIGLKEGIKGICCSFINLMGFKHISRYYSLKYELKKIISRFPNNEDILIIIYDLQVEYLQTVNYLKKRNKLLRTCLIVPDLNGYTGDPQSLFYRLYGDIKQIQLNNLYKSIDSYVLISKYMIEKLPVDNKPWVVIEGIFNFYNELKCKYIDNKSRKILFYSGALDERNGVKKLLEAFSIVNNPDIHLTICGDGPLKSEIEKAVLKDNRIKYKGQLLHSEVLLLQKDSFLLINPRTSGQDFTRYSFPSKTMEYFGSGVPVLMYNLEGVPKEYYSYCFTPHDESVEALAKCIIEVCNYDIETLRIIGEKAKNFVKQEKNSLLQVNKLLEMAFKLFENEKENSTN